MVRFVNLEGKTKQFRRQMSEIHFDIKPESVGKYTSGKSLKSQLNSGIQ